MVDDASHAGPPSGEPSQRTRRFTRFSDPASPAEGRFPLPEDGLCLSAFVIASPDRTGRQVLLGRIDRSAAWGEIGALDPKRVESIGQRWMIPSSQLLFFEGPDEAVRRILREQLGREGLPVPRPEVHSETYAPRNHPGRARHWDLHFLYRVEWPEPRPPTHSAWKELRFVDPAGIPRSEFARSHDEILELAGYRLR